MKFVIEFLKPTKGKIFIFLGIALVSGVTWGIFFSLCAFTYSSACEVLEPVLLVLVGAGHIIESLTDIEFRQYDWLWLYWIYWYVPSCIIYFIFKKVKGRKSITQNRF
jgi:hypothetical protein